MKFWDKVKAFFVWLWSGIVAVAKQLWSVISDFEKDADPWKIAGLGMFVLAAFGGIWVFDHSALEVEKLGIYSGLVASAITVGTFLFNQSRKSDAALIARSQADIPATADKGI